MGFFLWVHHSALRTRFVHDTLLQYSRTMYCTTEQVQAVLCKHSTTYTVIFRWVGRQPCISRRYYRSMLRVVLHLHLAGLGFTDTSYISTCTCEVHGTQTEGTSPRKIVVAGTQTMQLVKMQIDGSKGGQCHKKKWYSSVFLLMIFFYAQHFKPPPFRGRVRDLKG